MPPPRPSPTSTTSQRHFAIDDDDSDDLISSSSTTILGHNEEHTGQNGAFRVVATGSRISTHLSQDPNQSNSNLDARTLSTPLALNVASSSDSNRDIMSTAEQNPLAEKPIRLVSWRDLPHKRQLAILTCSRLSEPLVQTSLQSYMFYQLKSFSPALPDSTIASQAGILQGSFTGAQFLTAMLWGRVADSEMFGRKFVLLVGLLGTMASCLGYGFVTSFWQAVLFRAAGGALNGNVGVMRTMISEIVKEKKFQSRAFLLLPMTFNIGVIVGPVLGGLLADPAGSYPRIFGGVAWLERYPYAPPNLLSAMFLATASVAVWLGLEETLPSIQHKEDIGTKYGRKLAELYRKFLGKNNARGHAYTAIADDEQLLGVSPISFEIRQEDLEMSPASPHSQPKREKAILRYKHRLSFRRIFTPNVICTLFAHGLLGCHLGTFNSLWFVFLSTPVADPAHPDPLNFKRRLPFIFTGGLGMPPIDVGMAMAILGIVGIAMQLFIYPYVNARLGTVKSWRISLYCFPLAYILVPFLSIVPSKSPPPAEKDGIFVWLAICGLLLIQVVGRTFALPATTILVNNCSPHPSVLGTLHGIGQSVSSGTRTIGPFVGGALYGLGLRYGVVGAVWWGLSGVAVCGCVASNWVREGDGHEIKLEGDDEAEADFQADAAK